MAKPNGILAMDPKQYREIDGVVFDLESYAKHCRPTPAAPQTPAAPAEETQTHGGAPAPVFAQDPFPAGWYPAEEARPAVPVMGGALPPVEVVSEDGGTVVQTVWLPCGSGSGSGSYLTSYTTSYRTSALSSGSGSYVFGSCTYLVGGYGLELI